MKITKAILLGAVLLLGLAAWAQEFPKAELGVDYSYVRYAPSAALTNGHSLNGAGGTIVYNINQYLGIKADLQGYGSTTSTFNLARFPNAFPRGGVAAVNGNLFTYLFGPQLKFRTPKVQPFAHLLVGGAHSNVYGNLYRLCQNNTLVCNFQAAPSGNAFAFLFGGGVDIPVSKLISIRPGTVDYLLTNFSNRFNNSNQNNFRYSAGINFNFGGQ